MLRSLILSMLSMFLNAFFAVLENKGGIPSPNKAKHARGFSRTVNTMGLLWGCMGRPENAGSFLGFVGVCLALVGICVGFFVGLVGVFVGFVGVLVGLGLGFS